MMLFRALGLRRFTLSHNPAWQIHQLVLASTVLLSFAPAAAVVATDTQARPNVVFIICDDLNDYVEGFDGHPQAVTPNISELAASGVRFTQAHCNIPICGPSRASLFTGIYPHHSGCYGFTEWYRYPVLKNSRTLMDHFRANGYHTLGTGKIMHHRLVESEWAEYGNAADYGPFAYDGETNQPHPDTPAPYRNIGAVDGSFGPLVSLKGRTSPEGKPLSWRIGGWKKPTELKVRSPSDHDRTPDEKNGDWAVMRLTELAADQTGQPFFMAVGFIRPHTPLIVPQRFFDMFPVEQIDLPAILDGDVDDTFARTIRGLPDGAEPDSSRTEDMGTRLFRELVRSYKTREEALRHFIQAYLASVASVDEQIGRVIDAVETTGLADSTIIVLTSDHGWGMGEKDYLYKNSLWQEATRVPLIVRAPRTADAGTECTPKMATGQAPMRCSLRSTNGEPPMTQPVKVMPSGMTHGVTFATKTARKNSTTPLLTPMNGRTSRPIHQPKASCWLFVTNSPLGSLLQAAFHHSQNGSRSRRPRPQRRLHVTRKKI
jgi:arylsulfatase A-like enzyme